MRQCGFGLWYQSYTGVMDKEISKDGSVRYLGNRALELWQYSCAQVQEIGLVGPWTLAG